jgi:hypothetical protein
MSDARTGAQILADLNPQPHEAGDVDLPQAGSRRRVPGRRGGAGQSQVDDATSARLASGVSAKTKKLAQKVRDLEEQIEAAQVRFVFRSMGRTGSPSLCRCVPLATRTCSTTNSATTATRCWTPRSASAWSPRCSRTAPSRLRPRGLRHLAAVDGSHERVRVRRAGPRRARGQRGGDGGPKIAAGVADSRQARQTLAGGSPLRSKPSCLRRLGAAGGPRDLHGEPGRPRRRSGSDRLRRGHPRVGVGREHARASSRSRRLRGVPRPCLGLPRAEAYRKQPFMVHKVTNYAEKAFRRRSARTARRTRRTPTDGTTA